MNSCILMAEIVQEPQLRYTPDQLALAEMLVQFPGLRAEDPPSTLKVVGWGNLAQEIQQQYQQGDRVIIEGRLNMNTVERPEGFKEKRAELTVQRIHPLGDSGRIDSSATVSAATGNLNASPGTGRSRTSEQVAPKNANSSPTPATATASTFDVDTNPEPGTPSPTYPLPPQEGQNIDDDIPF